MIYIYIVRLYAQLELNLCSWLKFCQKVLEQETKWEGKKKKQKKTNASIQTYIKKMTRETSKISVKKVINIYH